MTASPAVAGSHDLEQAAGPCNFSPIVDGNTFVIRAGPKFELLGKNSPGELCMATPAIVSDEVIIRAESHVCRIK